MYELIQAFGNSYYINCPAKIGLVRLGGDDVCLIDGGSDKEAGRKVKKLLEEKGWHLTAIYNTHSNADHIGGNRYLQQNTGCRIFAPEIECDFTNHTVLEPSFLYGGYPFKELRHKFLMAQESRAEYLTDECLPDSLKKIDLPGHFFSMAGFISEDGAVYLADCLSSAETIDKYKITFIYDVAGYLDTLQKVKKLEGRIFIPSHADATDNIAPLAQINIDSVLYTGDTILRICAEPRSSEDILAALFAEYGLAMTYEQYVLVGSTVRSYLSWLKDKGRVEAFFEGNRLLWRAV